jgi:hypothetical protein
MVEFYYGRIGKTRKFVTPKDVPIVIYENLAWEVFSGDGVKGFEGEE